MRVLQLCNKPPLPAIDGGCIAMNTVTQGLLKSGATIKVLTIFTHKHDFAVESMPPGYVAQTDIEGVFVDTRVNVVDAFANFMTADSYNVSRFFSTDFDIRLTRCLQDATYDVVHLESLFMTPYISTIRRYSDARIVLRSHNLEFALWEKMAHGARNLARKAYLNYLSRKLREYELSILSQVDGIAAISEEDRRHFVELGVKKPVEAIPFALPVHEYLPPAGHKPRLALFHIGAMDWSPNLEGIVWFLEDIWPHIHQAFPALTLHLAGRNMPADLITAAASGVVFEGEVADARAFMHDKAIMIVPLLSGGGIRVKIIEGMACGKAIISTPVGAEGIDCRHGEHILLAENATQWVEAIGQLVNEPGRMETIGARAMALAAAHFDIDNVTARLIEFYHALRRP